MALFKRKLVDPCELLLANLIANKTVWASFARMPAKQQQAGLANMPTGLRDTYRKAKAADPTRADNIIAEARKYSLQAEPAQMSWQQLLDYAVT